jgi:hypothetical protein
VAESFDEYVARVSAEQRAKAAVPAPPRISRKVRLPARVLFFLDGTQAARDASQDDHPAIRKALDPTPRKDGSVVVELSPAERDVIVDYVEVLEIGALDNCGPDSADRPDALADVNAARAAIRGLRG